MSKFKSSIGARDGKRFAELIRYIDMDYVKDAECLGDIVHHKEYITADKIFNPAVTINFDNLELLCIDCHNKEHIEKNIFTTDGELKPREENILELVGVYKK